MKVFISWSGQQSRAVAEALNRWLPLVIQAVQPFYSPHIEKGVNWSGEIDAALEGTEFGIVCLTRQNLRAPWVLYEAGALSKTRGARVWTFLLDLAPAEVEHPLGNFQHTMAEKEDVRRLIHTINAQLTNTGGRPLTEPRLNEIFETYWPRLNDQLVEARSLAPPEAERPDGTAREIRAERDMLEEILELLRTQDRQRRKLEKQGRAWVNTGVFTASGSGIALARSGPWPPHGTRAWTGAPQEKIYAADLELKGELPEASLVLRGLRATLNVANAEIGNVASDTTTVRLRFRQAIDSADITDFLTNLATDVGTRIVGFTGWVLDDSPE